MLLTVKLLFGEAFYFHQFVIQTLKSKVAFICIVWYFQGSMNAPKKYIILVPADEKTVSPTLMEPCKPYQRYRTWLHKSAHNRRKKQIFDFVYRRCAYS
jgi:hypothetical protein